MASGEQVGAEDFDEFLGRFGELGVFLFEEENFAGRCGRREGTDVDVGAIAAADGELGNDSVSQIGADHGEGRFKLVTLEAGLVFRKTADFERLFTEAMAVGPFFVPYNQMDR